MGEQYSPFWIWLRKIDDLYFNRTFLHPIVLEGLMNEEKEYM